MTIPLRFLSRAQGWLLFLVFCTTMGTGTSYSASPNNPLFLPLPTAPSADAPPVNPDREKQIKGRASTKSYRLVAVNLAALLSPTTSMTLADSAPSVVASRTSLKRKDAKNFIWKGKLKDFRGDATLVVNDGKIAGTISDGKDVYRVESVNDGIHAVIKVDQSRMPPEDAPRGEEKKQPNGVKPMALSSAPLPSADAIADPTKVNVMVAYTSSAEGATGNIRGIIQIAVDEANQAYKNSQINLSLILVDTFRVQYTEAATFDAVLHDFRGLASVKQHRARSHADLSVLLINRSEYCGLAADIPADSDSAFAVVYYDCADSPYYSFAHELGHLMGARHDEANDPTPGYNHGHVYSGADDQWRTIMSYNCSGGCRRIPYFSNPNVALNGVATGIAGSHDNARMMNLTATLMASFHNQQGSILNAGLDKPPGHHAKADEAPPLGADRSSEGATPPK